METIGRLSGPELTAEDGRAYRAGDRIITLCPGPQGAWVTSQTATVTAVDPEQRTLQAVTPDGQQLSFGSDDIGPGKVDWGYAITAYRSQGATVDTAHVLADGGGRELAYVAMSRARQQSHVYLAAPSRVEALPRLVWQWEQQRRQHWVTAPAGPSIEQLRAERQRLIDTIPPGVAQRLAAVRAEQTAAQRDIDHLNTGAGRWATPRSATPSVAATKRSGRTGEPNDEQPTPPSASLPAVQLDGPNRPPRPTSTTPPPTSTTPPPTWTPPSSPTEHTSTRRRKSCPTTPTSSPTPIKRAPPSSPPTPRSPTRSPNSTARSPRPNERGQDPRPDPTIFGGTVPPTADTAAGAPAARHGRLIRPRHPEPRTPDPASRSSSEPGR